MPTNEKLQARALYHEFATTIELEVVRRQEEMDEQAIRFQQALDNLRDDRVTREDWQLLSSRVQSVVPSEIPAFKDAIRIYSTKA